jgi:hypothetical protein
MQRALSDDFQKNSERPSGGWRHRKDQLVARIGRRAGEEREGKGRGYVLDEEQSETLVGGADLQQSSFPNQFQLL